LRLPRYGALFEDKVGELGGQKQKLANGLAKLEEAQESVAVLRVDLDKATIVVSAASEACEKLLVVIVAERQDADAQKAKVEADSARIGKEAEECNAIAADAQADLAVAMPALAKAMSEVDKLDKSAISEVKAYAKPPPAVETVLAACMVLFGQKTDWATAKGFLGRSDFLQLVKGCVAAFLCGAAAVVAVSPN